MNTTTKPTWSNRDEAELSELQKRRQAFIDTNKPAVRKAVIACYDGLENQPVRLEGIVNIWIDNADAIRDALAPFDSGVRVAQSDSTSG